MPSVPLSTYPAFAAGAALSLLFFRRWRIAKAASAEAPPLELKSSQSSLDEDFFTAGSAAASHTPPSAPPPGPAPAAPQPAAPQPAAPQPAAPQPALPAPAPAADEEDYEEYITNRLVELYCWWYGYSSSAGRKLAVGEDAALVRKDLPRTVTEDAWRGRWFAKGELTAPIDQYLDDNFKELLDEGTLFDLVRARVGRTSPPLAVWERMALIILLDQVTRNVYRGKAKGYSFDDLCRPLAIGAIAMKEKKEETEEEEKKKGKGEGLPLIHQLPFHFRATVLICLCYSENLEHQEMLREHLDSASFRPYKESHRDLSKALGQIYRNHAERVELFGRFPERNKALGRDTTDAERAFLRALY